MQVVHDRKQPRTQITAKTPQAALLPRTSKRVLHQVISATDVASENSGSFASAEGLQATQRLAARPRCQPLPALQVITVSISNPSAGPAKAKTTFRAENHDFIRGF